jgi:beta-lactamase regulating signal transducer with metallopeptidase domain
MGHHIIQARQCTTKYWIWVATSLNLILPLGALLDKSFAAHLRWARPLGVIGEAGLRIADNAAVVGAVWLLGTILMAWRLCMRIRAARRDAHSGQETTYSAPGFFVQGIPVRFVASRSGPVVDGILRTRISLPNGIDRLLTRSELNAVIMHELTHARRRDNLIWLVHEAGLCLLWFHPLVWITGSRLAVYRELSCDESVIENAHGGELVSALAKLAHPANPEAFLFQASASSFIKRRLAQLAENPPPRSSFAANALLIAAFGISVVAGIYSTVAHTACCFRH